MSGSEGLSLADGYKDRRTGLIVFGILLIGLGLLCALIGPATLLFLAVLGPSAAAESVNVRTAVLVCIVYLGFAVLFGWLGIGSIRCRRWARALVVAIAWLWLVCGAIGLAGFVLGGRATFETMPAGGEAAEAFVSAMIAVMAAFLILLCILLPGALLLFYRGRHVKATCERRDPRIRWTDRCPESVLPLVVLLAAGTSTVLFAGASEFAIALFGVVLSGLPGALVYVVFSLLSGRLAWGAYRLEMAAWWGAFLLTILWGASGLVSMASGAMPALLEKMSFTEAQQEMVTRSPSGLLPVAAVSSALLPAYLLFVRRHFVRAARGRDAGTPGLSA